MKTQTEFETRIKYTVECDDIVLSVKINASLLEHLRNCCLFKEGTTERNRYLVYRWVRNALPDTITPLLFNVELLQNGTATFSTAQFHTQDLNGFEQYVSSSSFYSFLRHTLKYLCELEQSHKVVVDNA